VALSNEDLKAVPQSERTWSTWNYAALWIGMSVCIPTYMLASGVMQIGMNWKQAIAAVLLGNLIVLIPMVLNGHAGAKYGIPFPVFARAAFGTKGANVPALLRAIVACGWFGIQTWIGGASLAVVVEKTFWPGIAQTSFVDEVLGTAEHGPVSVTGKVDPNGVRSVTVNGTPATIDEKGAWVCQAVRDKDHRVDVTTTFKSGQATTVKQRVSWGAFDVSTGAFGCFLVFWVVNMLVVLAGIDSIRKLLVVKSVFLPAATLALFLWAYTAAHGLGDMLSKPSTFANTREFLKVFAPTLTGMVGFWSTLSLNIPDFTRYAKSQKAQMVGQAVALPTSMTAVAFVGVAVTSATTMLPAFGKDGEWDPVKVVQTFDSKATVAFAMFCIVLSTLATNIAANIVSPANDFSNLAPSKIGFRLGGLITGIVGILMFPWKLIENPGKYINGWLVGYSGLLGPIAGILIADYFIVRRQALDVDDLYSETGRYRYAGGWNPAALIAFVLGVLPCVPGFLVRAQVLSASEGSALDTFAQFYDYAWFVGFGISLVVHLALTKMRGTDAMRDQKAAV